MKKLFLIPVLFLLSACNTTPNEPHAIQDTKASIAGNYLGSDYKGNYVWGGAMNLAWIDLSENIIKEKIKLLTEDSTALAMMEKLNDPIFTKKDLDEESYYIKSGYGQETVDAVNKESKEKFPTKSFADLRMNLGPKDILAYAYFLKEVEYKTPFKPDDLFFDEQKVKSFYAEGEQKDNVEIIKYESDDKFIIRLKLKDEADHLILAKGYDMRNPEQVVEEIKNNNQETLPRIDYVDNFETPLLHLDYHRDYIELIGKFLANKGFENYVIAQMYENIKFDMDEAGARVENEAVIELTESSAEPSEEPPKNKNFILNKPFWVVMQRADSSNPYFILGVNNTDLMEKITN